jgi:peptidase A4-like protein
MKRAWLTVALTSLVLVIPGAASTAAPAIYHGALPHLIHRGNGSVQSSNWSGYAAYNATFTDVKASWIQPAANCSSTTTAQYASFWVGLDGYKSSSVEQLGTDSDCAGRNTPAYYAWWEMYPNPSNQISGFTVRAGDSISAEVSRTATLYTLSIVNNSTGQRFSTTQASTAANSSAEWVAEAPSQCIIVFCRVLPLANFGTMTFTGSYATSGTQKSISGYTNDSITMTDMLGTTVRAQPSALSPDGTSFSDTWRHS